MEDLNSAELELIEDFADTLCLAVEQLSPETIANCLQAAIQQDIDYHERERDKYIAVRNAIKSI